MRANNGAPPIRRRLRSSTLKRAILHHNQQKSVVIIRFQGEEISPARTSAGDINFGSKCKIPFVVLRMLNITNIRIGRVSTGDECTYKVYFYNADVGFVQVSCNIFLERRRGSEKI